VQFIEESSSPSSSSPCWLWFVTLLCVRRRQKSLFIWDRRTLEKIFSFSSKLVFHLFIFMNSWLHSFISHLRATLKTRNLNPLWTFTFSIGREKATGVGWDIHVIMQNRHIETQRGLKKPNVINWGELTWNVWNCFCV